MSETLINLIRMQMACLSAASYSGNLFSMEHYRQNDIYGSVPSDKRKCQPKVQHEFVIRGVKIIAASRKDAIKKFNHRKR